MKTCFELPQYGIKLEQSAKCIFRVTYGLQVIAVLGYDQACKELGECIVHALSCDNLINNEG